MTYTSRDLTGKNAEHMSNSSDERVHVTEKGVVASVDERDWTPEEEKKIVYEDGMAPWNPPDC
jgi:hypothetical protein